MNVLGNDWNKVYKKFVCVVGDVIGKYYFYGDLVVYDMIVCMVQLFLLCYMLVDGQGNFGFIDGDFVVIMCYMEICLVKIVYELMVDFEKEMVDFVDNYDGMEKILDVMLIKIFNLLVNGFFGIVVGMVINILLYNLMEVINGCLVYIDDEDISIEGLMEYILGLDFLMVVIINGCCGIEEVYCIGCGKVYICVCVEVEVDVKIGCEIIIVYEILYQVNKVCLIEKIVELVKEKCVEGISVLCDEFDKDGMCIVIEVKCDVVGEVVFNNFYFQIQLQVFFGINMVVLYYGQLKIMNLKDIIVVFVCYCCEVVICCIIFELCKVCDCVYIFEVLVVVLVNIDLIIELICYVLMFVEVKIVLVVNLWQLGNVVVMFECVGDDVVCLEWLELEFGVCDGLYYLIEQ